MDYDKRNEAFVTSVVRGREIRILFLFRSFHFSMIKVTLLAK